MDFLQLKPTDFGREFSPISCPEVVCHSPETVSRPELLIVDVSSTECPSVPLTDCHKSRSLCDFDLTDDHDNALNTPPPSPRFLSVPQLGAMNVTIGFIYIRPPSTYRHT